MLTSFPSGTAIKKDVDRFVEQANNFHPTIKFTAEISENKIAFLDTVVFKGERFTKDSTLDIKTHYKPTETFQYTQFTSCHPPGVKKGFIKGEAMRLLRTNSSKTSSFEECLMKFKNNASKHAVIRKHLWKGLCQGLPLPLDNRLLQKKKNDNERLLPIAYQPAVKNFKQMLMEQWSLIQNQPLLKTIYKKLPIISYK